MDHRLKNGVRLSAAMKRWASWEHENIEKIADIDGVEIFQSLTSMCGDFPKICVNKKKENYKIKT